MHVLRTKGNMKKKGGCLTASWRLVLLALSLSFSTGEQETTKYGCLCDSTVGTIGREFSTSNFSTSVVCGSIDGDRILEGDGVNRTECPDGLLCYTDLPVGGTISDVCTQPRCNCNTELSSFLCDGGYTKECAPHETCREHPGWGFLLYNFSDFFGCVPTCSCERRWEVAPFNGFVCDFGDGERTPAQGKLSNTHCAFWEACVPEDTFLYGDWEKACAVVPDWTITQQRTLIWTTRVSATFSLVGSCLIIYIVLKRLMKVKQCSVRERLLLGMSTADILSSFAQMVDTGAIPKEIPGVVGAMGTEGTCRAQGFLIQFGFAAPLYNCMICILSFLVIRKGLPEYEIVKYYEPFMHLVSIGYPLGTAIAALVLDLYHSNGAFCWIEPYPYKCHELDWGEYCEGEHDAMFYSWIFGGLILFVAMAVIVTTMTLVYCTVRSTFKAMRERFGEHNVNYDKIKFVFIQAMQYVGAFFMTYFWTVLVVILRFGNKDIPFALHFIVHTFLPLQGFWNFLIFIHPTFRQQRRRNPDGSFFKVLAAAIQAETTRRQNVRSVRRRISKATNTDSRGGSLRPFFDLVKKASKDWSLKDLFMFGGNGSSDSRQSPEVSFDKGTPVEHQDRPNNRGVEDFDAVGGGSVLANDNGPDDIPQVFEGEIGASKWSAIERDGEGVPVPNDVPQAFSTSSSSEQASLSSAESSFGAPSQLSSIEESDSSPKPLLSDGLTRSSFDRPESTENREAVSSSEEIVFGRASQMSSTEEDGISNPLFTKGPGWSSIDMAESAEEEKVEEA